MVNVVAIIVPIVVGIIIIAVSLYLFTVYCHRNIHLTQLNNEALATNSSQKYLSYSLKHLPGDNYFYSH